MSDATVMGIIEALDDDCPLYRAVLDARWINRDNGRIKPRVFMRRPPDKAGNARDVDGLSVALANGRDETTTCAEEASPFNDCTAVCRIFTSDVRSLGLDAIPDSPTHANITGLPEVPPADIGTPEGKQARIYAESVGGDLAKLALVVWRSP